MREMTVESVRINKETNQRVVILQEIAQERYLFIWTAHAEAYAIALELQGTPYPRPFMHDLFKNMMSAFGINFVHMIISDIIDDVFYARIVFEDAGRRIEVDAQPSNAVVIAMRVRIPIYAEDHVLERAGTSLSEDTTLSHQP